MNKKKYVGDVYFVSPEHVVEKNRIKSYKEAKGKDSTNKRPVMVGVEKSSNKVQISDISTKATRKEIVGGLAVELKSSGFKRKSYVDTSTRSKSEYSNKHFKVGEPPLDKKSNIKISKQDIDRYHAARKRRYRKK